MTAVEFYNSKVIELMKQREQGTIDVLNFRNELDQVFEQAKEMEKEQIVEAFFQGVDRESDCHGARYLDEKDAEKYYNTTFKSE